MYFVIQLISLKFEHLRFSIFPGVENFEIKIQIILLQYEVLESGLYHDVNGIDANQKVEH